MSATTRKNPMSRLPSAFIETHYTSVPVPIPDTFLSTTPSHARQTTYHKIDFAKTPLPEYAGRYAVVLDNVLSAAECVELVRLTQASAGASSSSPSDGNPNNLGDSQAVLPAPDIVPSPPHHDGWQPALVNAGANREVLITDYRNSDRIVWDESTIVGRLLARCFTAGEGQVERDLSAIEGVEKESILGKKAVQLGHRWRFTRGNERMRFLRYGRGQFFREHYDGTYTTPSGQERTFYTLHLYLNDSRAASSSDPPPSTSPTLSLPSPTTTVTSALPPLISGGATTFYSADSSRQVSVAPKAGRVLIFQHRGLYHAGDEVGEGVKYTMRTDLLYEFDEGCGAVLSSGR